MGDVQVKSQAPFHHSFCSALFGSHFSAFHFDLLQIWTRIGKAVGRAKLSS